MRKLLESILKPIIYTYFLIRKEEICFSKGERMLKTLKYYGCDEVEILLL